MSGTGKTAQQISYFPMQNRENTRPNTSSLVTEPTISPSASRA
jgi:hypothetical protein